jgi:hypothetical protein
MMKLGTSASATMSYIACGLRPPRLTAKVLSTRSESSLSTTAGATSDPCHRAATSGVGGAPRGIRTPNRQIRSLVLSVDLVGSRRIWPAQVGGAVGRVGSTDGSSRIVWMIIGMIKPPGGIATTASRRERMAAESPHSPGPSPLEMYALGAERSSGPLAGTGIGHGGSSRSWPHVLALLSPGDGND